MEVAASDLFTLEIETFNGTGWPALKAWLARSKAAVICAQETKLRKEAIPYASKWALARGWKSLWTQAAPGERDQDARGGSALFVRDAYGLRAPEGGHVIVDARVVAGICEFPGFPPMLVASAYFKHGGSWCETNVAVAEALGRLQQMVALPFVFGGDCQMKPADFDSKGFVGACGAVLLAPDERMGTCRASTGTYSTIDFFLASASLALAVEKTEARHEEVANPHVPVRLSFSPKAAQTTSMQFAVLQTLPKERIVGPLLAPPSYLEAKMACAEALREAHRSGGKARKQRKLDRAFRLFANVAEAELAAATGVQIRTPGRRGRLVKLTSQPVLKQRLAPQHLFHPVVVTAKLASWTAALAKDCAAAVASGAPLRSIKERATLELPDEGLAQDEVTLELAKWRRIIAAQAEGTDPAEEAESLRMDALAAAVAAESAQQKAVKHANDQWKTWAEEANGGGAAKAHAFTRLQDEWTPTAAVLEDRSLSAKPEAFLEQEVEKWATEWDEKSGMDGNHDHEGGMSDALAREWNLWASLPRRSCAKRRRPSR